MLKNSNTHKQQQQGIYSPRQILPNHSGMWLRRKDAGNPANGPSRRPSSRQCFQSVGIQALSRPRRICRPSSVFGADPRGSPTSSKCWQDLEEASKSDAPKPSPMADYWRSSTLSCPTLLPSERRLFTQV